MNARPKSEKWMWSGRQAFGWFPHGYAPGLIVTNLIGRRVGQAAARAGEVRVERRRLLVDVVLVPAGGVRLPDLDSWPRRGLPVAAEHPPGRR